jgi:hypothetical protein
MPIHKPGITNTTRHLMESIANKPKDKYGKEIVKADSRPTGSQTLFTMKGDDQAIGDGKELFWDFSNNDDIIDSTSVLNTEIPAGYKCKQIKLKFNDPIWLKEGTIYFSNSVKKSFCYLSIVCPSGQYYLNRVGNPVQATEDTNVIVYVRHHFFSGTCIIGDELNTEACQEDPVPSNYYIVAEIFVPESDNESFGYCELEIYRERSILLPGESL